MADKCSNCKFWKRIEPGHNLGECRVIAPVLFEAFGDSTRHYDRTPEEIAQYTLFPIIDKQQWCGQYQPE